LTALNGPTGRRDEHDAPTITKDPQDFFADVVVFVKAVGALMLDSVNSGVSGGLVACLR
jgi:hypothetical protein